MKAKPKAKKTKSPNDRVLEVLRKTRKPLSAYDILGVLNKDGITAPPTVYRALAKLVSDGCAHRIETLNSYIACSEDTHSHTGHHSHHSDNNFAVCRSCGDVTEIHDHKIDKIIKDWSASNNFHIERNMMELIGTCNSCSGAQ